MKQYLEVYPIRAETIETQGDNGLHYKCCNIQSIQTIDIYCEPGEEQDIGFLASRLGVDAE